MSFVVIGGILYLFMRQNRERTANAPLRGEIQARARFATKLDHASILGTGGFRGTRGQWISLRGPKRLVVGADAFMISSPQALREFVFTGRESSIRFSQAPSRLVQRDWIVITGQASDRQVQLRSRRRRACQRSGRRLPEPVQHRTGTPLAKASARRCQMTRPSSPSSNTPKPDWAPVMTRLGGREGFAGDLGIHPDPSAGVLDGQ